LTLSATGKHKEAVLDCDKAIELDPGDEYAYNNRGMAKYQLLDIKGALSDFEKATELNPKFATAFFNAAYVQYKTGNKKEACGDMEKANELGYKNADEWAKKICR
jgi:tetratricopeptide (TPR) repeat protein